MTLLSETDGGQNRGATASPSGSRPSDQAQLHGPDASRVDPSRKCECDTEGRLQPGWADWYDAELELPYVNHAPGECQCTNDLAQYRACDGAVRWLCSCCCTFSDERLASAGEAGTAATTKIDAVHEHATAAGGDAQNNAQDIGGPSQ